MSRLDALVLGIRLAAILLIIIVVPLLWRVMLWLPWQMDCALAAAAAFAFAYVFDNEPRA
jgi:hypothetical protein